MVRFLSIALLSVSADLLLGSAAAQPVTDFVIEPGRRAGIVTRDMTEARLKKLLPKGQVKRVFRHDHTWVYRCGTEIFSGTENAAFIAWGSMDRTYDRDSKANVRECMALPSASEPRRIIIERNAARPDQPSAWRLSNGMSLGMTIHGLQAVAGEPFDVLLCRCEFDSLVISQPKSLAFRGIDLWIAFPEEARKALKDLVRPDVDDAVHAADVPTAMGPKLVLSKIAVSLEPGHEE